MKLIQKKGSLKNRFKSLLAARGQADSVEVNICQRCFKRIEPVLANYDTSYALRFVKMKKIFIFVYKKLNPG